MINFTHKPCQTEGKNAEKIANRIIKKSKNKINHLEFLLRKHFNTNLIKPISLKEIDDFPRISLKKLKNKVLLGIFQLKQCKSYIEDLVSFSQMFIVDSKANKKSDFKNSNSKIVCLEIPSRHKRGKKNKQETNHINNFRNKYKVFVQYIPNQNKTKAIKGIFSLFKE